jgi:hypothetical protein
MRKAIGTIQIRTLFPNWVHKNDLAHLDLSAKEDGILVHAE